ncbi:hypothetical protein KVD77_05775 [Helicobacter pylori]|uniref:hypothetical protein n=1 Tax=Helicobacter pylori TaxID=210 RepID=UPI00165CA5DD|nr:hypothetical protein [Helicobacter pylori]WQT55721.1 hypothetical protein KVD77_05775 [Helicobacter pylori]WQW74870.1 hypothetical protein KVM72_05670 [Helicobacter pylori]
MRLIKFKKLKRVFLVAFKPFKKGLGVYFQKGFVFFVFSYFYKELKMDKQKVKLLEHCYTMILSINATFMRLELKNFNP